MTVGETGAPQAWPETEAGTQPRPEVEELAAEEPASADVEPPAAEEPASLEPDPPAAEEPASLEPDPPAAEEPAAPEPDESVVDAGDPVEETEDRAEEPAPAPEVRADEPGDDAGEPAPEAQDPADEPQADPGPAAQAPLVDPLERRMIEVSALLQDAIACEGSDSGHAAVLLREAIVACLDATEDPLGAECVRRDLLEGFDRLSALLAQEGLPEEALAVVDDAAALGLLGVAENGSAGRRDALKARREDLRRVVFADSAGL